MSNENSKQQNAEAAEVANNEQQTATPTEKPIKSPRTWATKLAYYSAGVATGIGAVFGYSYWKSRGAAA